MRHMYRSVYQAPTLFLLLLLVVLSCGAQRRGFSENHELNLSSWETIDSLIKKGLTQTAMDSTIALFESAKSSANNEQMIKALIYRLRLSSYKEEDASIKAINRLRREVAQSVFPVDAVLNSMLGELYRHFYEENRWQILNRTQTVDFKPDDIRSWDLRTIIEKTTASYMRSLKNAEKLKTIVLDSIHVIVSHEGTAKELQPTLYDLLIHRAVDYFSMDYNELIKPSFQFTLASEDYFKPFDTFSRLKLMSQDSTSLKLHALQLLQKLISFHAKDASPEALIHADLKRLDFVWQRSVHKEKDSLYIAALQHLERRFSTHFSSSEVTFKIAEHFFSQTGNYDHQKNPKGRWMYKKAITLCNKAVKAFPESYGAKSCGYLIDQIKKKEIGFSIESVNLPDKPFKALLDFRNVHKVYLRQIEVTPEEYRTISRRYHQDSIVKVLIRKKPVTEWSIQLPDPGDYRKHTAEIALPALPCGQYVVICYSHPKFYVARTGIAWSATQISNISYRSRSGKNGGLELQLLNRTTGFPLVNYKITTWVDSYNQKKRIPERKQSGNAITDKGGYAVVPGSADNHHNYFIDCSKGDDQLISANALYHYPVSEQKRNRRLRTWFFTDRAIYRPGQTIYFKGLMLSTDGESNRIAVNRKTKVTLRDVNYQEIAHLNCTSNEYGSFHGSFITPVNVLTGTMRIENSSGSYTISVEDYKRPKFSVSIHPVKGTAKLGDTLSISGRAKAYTGASTDGAQVRYRVVRNAIIPRYWWQRSTYYQPHPQMEIANGSTVTNDTGGFVIEFAAIADQSIPASDNPLFNYSIVVDITDINGETQSNESTVSLGYKSLMLSLDIAECVSSDTDFVIPIATTNSSGVFESATGTIAIHKLETPETIFRKRYWHLPDTAILSEKEFREQFPHDCFSNEDDITTWKRSTRVFTSEFATKKSREVIVENVSQWQPGIYVAEGTTTDRQGNNVTAINYFTLYSKERKTLPYPQADWFLPVKAKGEPGEKALFIIGSGYENVKVYFETEHKTRITRKPAFTLSNEQKLIEIPIEEKHRGNFSLHLYFVHHNRTYKHTVEISVPWTNKELQLSFSTFRDKVAPGEKEQWQIKITGYGKDRMAAEMAATLYDASLDAFTPHRWTFSSNPIYRARRGWSADNGFTSHNALFYASEWNTISNVPQRTFPQFNWFSYRLRNSSFLNLKKRGALRIRPRRKALSKRNVASADIFAKGGFAADIDAILEGAGGLKAGASGDVGRKGVAGIGYGAGYGSGFGGGGRIEKSAQPENNPDLSAISTRRNLNETAFFFPQLNTDKNGDVIISFTMPEALTQWNMIGFAHTKDLCYGQVTNKLVTRKQLMIVPNPPRFFRENDRITFTAKVTNLSDTLLSGSARLFLFDAATMKPLDTSFKNSNNQIPFNVTKGLSTSLGWDLSIPEGVGAVTFKVVAKAGTFSDGEEQIVPVLSNRMMVTESVPLPIRKKESKQFTLKNLISQNNGSKTLRNHKLTLEFTTNPAWYAIAALPYLIEYPYACAEQIFSRFYANSIASQIVNSSPEIRSVFDSWRTLSPDALLSNLEKNQELKALALEETPWLLDGRNESERKKRIALLFDMNKMANERESALVRLKKMQQSNGGWPWFDGMPDNRYITQYIAAGLGRLNHLGSISFKGNSAITDMRNRALIYLDNRIREDFANVLKQGDIDKNNLGQLQIQYLYMRSFFTDTKITSGCKRAFDYYCGQAEKYWLENSRYMQGMIAIALNRYNTISTSEKIMRSLKENALVSEEMGMYWKEMYEGYSWRWYEAPIESQALLIEAFEEVARDTVSAEALKVWLLKSKQTQNWPTTRSTAEACYALLLRGTGWLSHPSQVAIKLGEEVIDPLKRDDIKAEAGTGYFKLAWSGEDIKPAMGNVTVTKNETGVAWGALYWQYFEQIDKIKPHETPLKLEKRLFLKRNSSTGPEITPIDNNTALKPGDKLTVRIELRVDRAMEYVHMKDMRASGFEPVTVFSGYRFKDGVGYYESTRDAANNFFFSNLNKGTYVFEYPLVVAHKGDFSNGVTSIQCMYAPEFAAHSEGVRVMVHK